MPGLLKLNAKEANSLADQIEENGGNADSLRATIEDVKDTKNSQSFAPANEIDDEEHIQRFRSRSTIEEGKNLECLVCHQKVDKLISGTCEACFEKWALTIKRRSLTQRLLWRGKSGD